MRAVLAEMQLIFIFALGPLKLLRAVNTGSMSTGGAFELSINGRVLMQDLRCAWHVAAATQNRSTTSANISCVSRASTRGMYS